jgi:hypothetical protein
MVNIRLHAVLLLNLFMVTGSCLAQLPGQVNYNYALTSINPSFAGSNGAYRGQQIAGTIRYNTNMTTHWYSSGFDKYVKETNSGLFVNMRVFHDEVRAFNLLFMHQSTNLSAGYAQYLSMFGRELKIVPSIGWDLSLYQEYQGDGGNKPPADRLLQLYSQTRFFTFTTRGGLLVNYKHLYLGGSVNNVLLKEQFKGQRYQEFSINLHASYNQRLGTKTLIRLASQLITVGHDEFLQGEMMFVFGGTIIMGGGLSHDEPFLNLGYRSNQVSLQISHAPNRYIPLRFYNNSWEIMMSFSLDHEPSPEKVRDFEKW